MSIVYDTVVVGGGLSGGAAAVALARAGQKVVVLERSAGAHDKVCGEFLSGEAASYLADLGLDLTALGAQPVGGVRFAYRRRAIAARLPFPASCLSRRVLDAALLRRAQSFGADIQEGAWVRQLRFRDGAWEARLQDGQPVRAGTALLATGKHDVRDLPRPKGAQHDLLGLKVYWRLSAPQRAALAGHVELMLFRGGYAGLTAVEGGRANLCLLVRRGRFAAAGRDWSRFLTAIREECALLDARLTDAEPEAARPLAIAGIPYGYVARPEAYDGAHLWRLGDQAAVIPSFSGDGMSIALHSARLAAEAILCGQSADMFQRRLGDEMGPRVRIATGLSLLAVNSLGARAVAESVFAIPRLLPAIAKATRIPPAALARAGISVAT